MNELKDLFNPPFTIDRVNGRDFIDDKECKIFEIISFEKIRMAKRQIELVNFICDALNNEFQRQFGGERWGAEIKHSTYSCWECPQCNVPATLPYNYCPSCGIRLMMPGDTNAD